MNALAQHHDREARHARQAAQLQHDGRRVVLFGKLYVWKAREKDGGKKAPRRYAGQWLLHGPKKMDETPAFGPLVQPCHDRCAQPLRGFIQKEN